MRKATSLVQHWWDTTIEPRFQLVSMDDFFSDINECNSKPCDAKNGICTNEQGSFKCVCNTGFFGDGFTCRGKETNHLLILPFHFMGVVKIIENKFCMLIKT